MAGQIYITGDCHTDFRRFNTEIFPEQKGMDKEDYVIICGDAGITWADDKEMRYWQKWLNDKPFTTLFVDGNHENFDLLNAYPVEEWHGGKVHRIRDSVFHLMRGQVFDICGKKIFTFGGARSHDIDGGILEPEDKNFKLKQKRMEKQHMLYRINHINWWKEEMATEEEFEEGRKNLNARDWTVDFIVTHCCSTATQNRLSDGGYEVDALTDFLDEIKEKCTFRKWFFGHYHDNQNVSEKEILLYEQMIRIC